MPWSRRGGLTSGKERTAVSAVVGAALPLQLLLRAAHSQNCVPSTSNLCPDVSFQVTVDPFHVGLASTFPCSHLTSSALFDPVQRGLPRDATRILPMLLQVPAAFSCSFSFLHGTLISLVSVLDNEPCYGSKLFHTSQIYLEV